MSTNKTIHDLVTELETYQNAKDKILPLLKSFLYSEHYATQLCEENSLETTFTYTCNDQITGKRPLSLPEKISKLIENNVLCQESYEIFKLLNDIRNKLVHVISPDTQEIMNWIGDFNPPTNKELLKLLNSANTWLRFYLCLIPAIANLYSKTRGAHIKLDRMEYNIPSGNWIFHFQ
jgi:uncharacterized protein YutE (UPF0331/DUF86 family)